MPITAGASSWNRRSRSVSASESPPAASRSRLSPPGSARRSLTRRRRTTSRSDRLPILTEDEGDTDAEPRGPPIPHETTYDTGIRNERGVLAYARRDPGTANSEFFFNLGDSPVLNGEGGPDCDGFGYATFGRVVRRLEVLGAIRRLPTAAPTEVEMARGRILNDPIPILHLRRAR